jgi:hypothetical protein
MAVDPGDADTIIVSATSGTGLVNQRELRVEGRSAANSQRTDA